MENAENALWIEIKNVVGAIKKISTVIVEHKGNINEIEQMGKKENINLYMEIDGVKNFPKLVRDLEKLEVVVTVTTVPSFGYVYG